MSASKDEIYVTQPSMPEFDEYVEAIRPLWKSKWLTNMGKYHNELEEELRKYLGVPNISLMVNGHMALELTIQAFEFPRGGEVITTPFTFASTTHAILRNGLEPVFCDIDPHTYCIDAGKIEELITEKTCAIIPVHVYGNVCDVEEIEKIAKKHGLKVIYDACHAFGERCNGKSVMTYGDASVLSFHATKVFNTVEGGACCYKDREIGERLYDLKNFGIHGPYEVRAVGANAKMNEFCAVMGLCNLRHIDEEIEKRKKIDEYYRDCLGDVHGIVLNERKCNVQYNYAYFPVLIDGCEFGRTRDDVFDALEEQGIHPRKYFYPLTSKYEAFRCKYLAENTPVANQTSEEVLTLPIYADLNLVDVERICKSIGSVK